MLADADGPAEGTLLWDGADESSKQLRIGAYLLVLEIPSTGKKIIKGIAIAGRK